MNPIVWTKITARWESTLLLRFEREYLLLKYEVISSLSSYQPVIYYLVKWCSLPYEDATWELKEDVDEGKVEEFKKIQNRQPRVKRAVSSLLKLSVCVRVCVRFR